MKNEEFIKLFEANLEKLGREIEQFSSEEDIWKTSDGINNPAGNLCLHLLGNLNHYVGAKLGNSGYVRDRPSEFSSKNIPRVELLTNVAKTSGVVTSALGSLSDRSLEDIYPDDEGGEPRTVAAELTSILNHLSYHLGQINYHRRLAASIGK